VKAYLQYLKGDRVIWIITLLMLAFSLVSVYSFVPILVKIEGGTPFKYLFKHFIYVGIAFGTMFWIHKRDPKYFSKISKFGYYVAIALLIFTFFFGTRVNDAGRWIKIPFVGLTFQSSDFAKLALILTVSRLLVVKKELLNSWKEGFFPVMIPIFVICGLIFKDNFSTAALLFMLCLALLYVGKVPFGKLFIVIGSGALILLLAIGVHKLIPSINLLPRYETWENRITNTLGDGEKNILANAQARNAQLAIYSGGIIGQGVGDGKLKEYLPEAYADFYYSSYVEEFGFVAAIILVMLYLILLYRIIQIGLRSEKLFETYFCVGVGILILIQASVNMLVCTGIFPVTGQNMPLLAMGGSALIMTCVAIGIVQSIARNQMKDDEDKEVEEVSRMNNEYQVDEN
jgi:cell division protein FtsW